jgi:hypothetical protein
MAEFRGAAEKVAGGAKAARRTSIERWAAQPVAETHDGPPADPNMSQKQLEDRKPWKDDRLDPRVFQKSIEQ